jgi:hypothetical protein
VTEPIFRREGDAFVPTGHARGPWDPDQLHGGAPGALVAQALEADGYLLARVTLEFLAPVPLAPLRLHAETTRPGRNVQLAEAELRDVDGRPVLRARAMRLRRASVELPPIDDERPVPPGPETARPSPFPPDPRHDEGFHRTGMDIRFAQGGSFDRGPARAWFRLARPLVDDEPAGPVARVVAAADFGNGVSRVVDFEELLFVNTDLSVHVHREPAGEWVMLDARTRLEPHGTGLAHSSLLDERGPLGMAAQSLFVAPRRR